MSLEEKIASLMEDTKKNTKTNTKISETLKKAHAYLENLDLRTLPDGYVEQLKEENKTLLESINNQMPFITKNLSEKVTIYAPSLTLIGAETGSGKSTVAANIAYVNLLNGRKTLIISNEERKIDVFNRISCLHHGLNLNKIKEFTSEENQKMNDYLDTVVQYVRVIDGEIPHLTNSLTGVNGILENICQKDHYWDCIILDYYQKVDKSDSIYATQLDTLTALGLSLEKYSKKVRAPIIVLSQLHPSTKENAIFESRIKMARHILTVATLCLEVKSNKNEHSTIWTCHKNRFGTSGWSITTKWEKGRYIDITGEKK